MGGVILRCFAQSNFLFRANRIKKTGMNKLIGIFPELSALETLQLNLG
jgi:hypothetical protein